MVGNLSAKMMNSSLGGAVLKGTNFIGNHNIALGVAYGLYKNHKQKKEAYNAAIAAGKTPEEAKAIASQSGSLLTNMGMGIAGATAIGKAGQYIQREGLKQNTHDMMSAIHKNGGTLSKEDAAKFNKINKHSMGVMKNYKDNGILGFGGHSGEEGMYNALNNYHQFRRTGTDEEYQKWLDDKDKTDKSENSD